MKRIKILLIIIVLFIIIGLFRVNLNLNRQIYMSIASDIRSEELNYNKERDSWNLDHMVEVLSYPNKYDIGDINGKKNLKENELTIPKVRILFSARPFDFRIDTKEYIFFINSSIVSKFKLKIGSINEKLKSSTLKLLDNI
ncbi:hypothetical protein GOM49_10810 [Clostridium bovifaecis]|uniref:Uncharacterized protein n=1 Tax=Clostridium bovifaecis TaxID=2184719 RepID=A0A6I6F2U0_9CLOT|nr:hypothetical protein GOM49_10810 [Clostridium bovifaecis]